MKVTQPGIFTIPADAYHADVDMCPEPSLSSGGARSIIPPKGCPAQFIYDRQNPKPPSVAFKVGSAAHEFTLEGDTWPQRHFVLPEGYDGRLKIWRATKEEAEAAEAEGKRVITADQFATVKGMRDALAAHPFAMAAFMNGEAEKSLYWRDREFGIWCRCRPDFLPRAGHIVADFKTADDVSPDELRRDIFAYGYHQQDAFYVDGIKAVGVIADPAFLLIFQCKRPPYLIVPVMLDDVAIEWGRTINRKAKAVFARCLHTGQWPGFADDVISLGLPGWAEAQLQRQHEAGLYETIAPQGEAA